MIRDFVGIDPGRITGIAVARYDYNYEYFQSFDSVAIKLDDDYEQEGLKACVNRIVKQVHAMTLSRPKPIVGVETVAIHVKVFSFIQAYLVGGLLCSDLNPVPINPSQAKAVIGLKRIRNEKKRDLKNRVIERIGEQYGHFPQGNQLEREAQADAIAVAVATRLLTD